MNNVIPNHFLHKNRTCPHYRNSAQYMANFRFETHACIYQIITRESHSMGQIKLKHYCYYYPCIYVGGPVTEISRIQVDNKGTYHSIYCGKNHMHVHLLLAQVVNGL